MLRTSTYTVYVIFLPSSLQCAVLQADRSHRGHGPLPVSGDCPRPILQPSNGGRSRGNRKNIHGREHIDQARPQGVQLPDRQHVSSGTFTCQLMYVNMSNMSTCQIRRHVKYIDMSAQERQQVRYTNMSCTSMSDQVHQHVCLGMSTCLLWYVKCSLRYVPVQVHIKGFITK